MPGTASGLFLTFEGGDGSGKSTQSALLTEWLSQQGRTVVHAREPGGTELGLELREIILHRRGYIAPGAGRVLEPAEVRDVSLWATEHLLPDLTILLDLDIETGRARLDDARTRYDRLEAEAAEFHHRVREAYLALAAAEPDRFLVLDATEPIETLAERIRARVSDLLA